MDRTHHFYGTALPQYEEHELPSKKPVHISEQIATDEHGRRRFHGAFTGGFSAGYWNTVGSAEGWTPQQFKSSRSEKAVMQKQRPEDFMDDEDLGEFGIGSERVLTREEYQTKTDDNKKRKLEHAEIGGIIPGTPVLEQIIEYKSENIGTRLLKCIGWRPGQGVGPRLSRKAKKQRKKYLRKTINSIKRYTCLHPEDMEKLCIDSEKQEKSTDESSTSGEDDEITFAPDDYEPFFCQIKKDKFGLGYTPLNRDPVLSDRSSTSTGGNHINFFENIEKRNRKLNIKGQAFGIGAFEEEDDDIYAPDDYSKYDFSLERKSKKKLTKYVEQASDVLEGFVAATHKLEEQPYWDIELPAGYKPRNWFERKTRFEPLDPARAKRLEKEFKKWNKSSRESRNFGSEFEEKPSSNIREAIAAKNSKPMTQDIKNVTKNSNESTKELLERISSKMNSFTQGGLITLDTEENQSDVGKTNENIKEGITVDLLEKGESEFIKLSSESSSFKPFLHNEAKQQRYEEFLAKNLRNEDEAAAFLKTIQPVSLSSWDRQMETREFIQAQNIYKPLAGSMLDRFISECAVKKEEEHKKLVKEKKEKKEIERTKIMWKPSALLCKRYNIPEPYGGTLEVEKKQNKKKLSIFGYLENSVHTKENFKTPVIIPKHIDLEKPKIEEKEQTTEKIITETSDQEPSLEITATATEKDTSEKKPNPKSKFVPKTDLQRWVVATNDQPPEDRSDLFKAIFDSSTDEDSAGGSDEDTANKSEFVKELETNMANLKKTTEPSKSLLAGAGNLLRNTSPPRGIFAALFSVPEKKISAPAVTPTPLNIINKAANVNDNTVTPTKILFKHKCEYDKNKGDESGVSLSDTYGPKLPESNKKIANRLSDLPDSDIDRKLLTLMQKQQTSKHKASVDEEWVETTGSLAVNREEIDSDTDSSSSSSCSRKKKDKTHKLKKKSKKNDKKHKKKHTKKSNKRSREKSHKRKKSR